MGLLNAPGSYHEQNSVSKASDTSVACLSVAYRNHPLFPMESSKIRNLEPTALLQAYRSMNEDRGWRHQACITSYYPIITQRLVESNARVGRSLVGGELNIYNKINKWVGGVGMRKDVNN